MEETLSALAEPNRRKILRLVKDKELSAGEVASYFDLTRPAVSQHLQVLAEAKLVTVRREGTKRMYRARPEGLDGLREYLEEFWIERLTVLKHFVEEEERNKEDAKGE